MSEPREPRSIQWYWREMAGRESDSDLPPLMQDAAHAGVDVG